MVTTTRNIWRQEFLRPGTYHGHPVTRDDLVEFARNTNHLLERGYAVPVFERHKPLGAEDGGPRFIQSGQQDDARDTVGWLKKVEVDDDGRAFHVIEVTDPKAHEKIENKSIRFTSPELTYSYQDADGNHIGKLIRHVALTPTPRNPHQGPFVAMSEQNPMQCVQFSLDDLDKPKKASDSLQEENTGDEEGDAEFNDDIPRAPVRKDADRVAKQILADLEAAGIAAPQGVDVLKDPISFVSQLSAALRQKAITEAEKAAEKEQSDMSVHEESGMAQYSEENIVQFAESHPDPLVRKLAADAIKSQREAVAARQAQHRDKLLSSIDGAAIPPWAKTKLTEAAGTVQFSEDGSEGPTMRVSDVLSLLKQFPKHLQFSENDTEEYAHESGDEFHAEGGGGMTDDRAEEIAAEMAGTGYTSARDRTIEFNGAGAGLGRNPEPAPQRQTTGTRRR